MSVIPTFKPSRENAMMDVKGQFSDNSSNLCYADKVYEWKDGHMDGRRRRQYPFGLNQRGRKYIADRIHRVTRAAIMIYMFYVW